MSSAGSLVCTDQNPQPTSARPIRKITVNWTANASGAVNGNPITTVSDGLGSAVNAVISGVILAVVFKSAVATYAAVLKQFNGDGVDLLNGQGASLTSTTARIVPGFVCTDGTNKTMAPGVVVDDILELDITGAGSGGTGTVEIYVR